MDANISLKRKAIIKFRVTFLQKYEFYFIDVDFQQTASSAVNDVFATHVLFIVQTTTKTFNML